MNTVFKNDHRLMRVLLAPIVSEKANFVGEKYTQTVFRVMRDANKQEVKAAVETLFKVRVRSVKILNQQGKLKRTGRFLARRNHSKKAYVCLESGQDISFDVGVK